MKIFSKLKWLKRHKELGYSKDELEHHVSTWVDECDGKLDIPNAPFRVENNR